MKKKNCPLQVVSLNANCWATAKETIEHIWKANAATSKISPAIFLVQALRLVADQLVLAENWARNRGYKFHGKPAKKTSDDPRALSAGADLLVAQAFGVKPGARVKSFPERICFADVVVASGVRT